MYSHPPLRRRVIKSVDDRQYYVTTSQQSLVCRGSYKKWNEGNMEKAIKEVEMGHMSLRRAAEVFSVPKSSLHDRLCGKVHCGSKPGPTPYLSYDEEEELTSFLIQTSKIGYPHTKAQTLAIVQRIVESKGIKAVVSNGWWERYKERHPKLTLKSAMPLSYPRAMANDLDVFNRYFDMLQETLESNGILNYPTHIFNCDETGLALAPKCLKIVDKVGSKNPSYVTGNSKSQITVLACSCAAGYVIPPFVIFKRKSKS